MLILVVALAAWIVLAVAVAGFCAAAKAGDRILSSPTDDLTPIL